MTESRRTKKTGPARELAGEMNRARRQGVTDRCEKDFDRITVNPNVCLGQPTVRGMRITIGVILRMLDGGQSVAEVLEAYPELEEEDVHQARRYANEYGLDCYGPIQ